MHNKSRKIAQPFQRNKKAAIPVAMSNELIELFQNGKWEKLALKAQSLTRSQPKNLLAWKALGKALLMQGNLAEAIAPLTQAIKFAPLEADAHNDLGYILNQLGRKTESEASYKRALKSNPKFAEAHNNLAILLADQGRLVEAEAHYQKALYINPNSAKTHNNLGSVHRDCGRLNQAIACFRQALELDQNYFDAWFNLGLTQQNLELLDDAQASFLHALTINSNSDMALNALGALLISIGGKDDVAQYCLQRALEINPNNADAYISLGNVLMRFGNTAEAIIKFREAKKRRPLVTRPSKKATADFSVLLLDSPLAGCTPVDYLLSNAAYDSHFYCLLENEDLQDIDFLRTKGNVVVNMISDADNGKELLPLTIEIANRLGLPIVNHPRLIAKTDRETIAQLITGIPLCKSPQTRMLSGKLLLEAAENAVLPGFKLPLLIRLTGCHGGDDCYKFADFSAMSDFVSKRPEVNYYVSEYQEYQSTDNYFRKYRLIYVNGELLPYHLAIHNDWLVHHFRTDMSNQAWMRLEEEAFLQNPLRVFDQAHLDALKALAISTGLDYLGIDCAIDHDGDVLVFEANATMRVHHENNETFAYKNPYITQIKDAFDSMLAKLASR